MTITAEIAEALLELEGYDDEEHRALLELVRAFLDQADDG